MPQVQTISHAKNPRNIQRDGKIQIRHDIRFKHGVLLNAIRQQFKSLCVTVLPWGLYQYNALPMGIKPATDIFQERMSSLFYDLQQIVVYMDDLKAFGFLDFDDHLN
jgi:hypothetical protein